ncbi:hypothetical protein MJO28_006187 [Puccinia striiformis f. sp. tritici]|uniref:Uncharacterized protein n=1 Tax=Puccinia striiformis f. sp. tritici TaxID=168172 RepID=A0ACC0EH45_9BASI|nr:hypothetical protein MJO28_006187 [Puccinia striiformis f. sp. tritici]KAI7957974.1 hypothetical protein MJO29_006191 [Puccinia striiformis f. sp. tritici]
MALDCSAKQLSFASEYRHGTCALPEELFQKTISQRNSKGPGKSKRWLDRNGSFGEPQASFADDKYDDKQANAAEDVILLTNSKKRPGNAKGRRIKMMRFATTSRRIWNHTQLTVSE